MLPGINPREMAKAMKKLGIQQQDIDAVEVIIKCRDKKIIISKPEVAKVNMMGSEVFQVSGIPKEVALDNSETDSNSEQANSTQPQITAEDIKTVAEQAKVSKDSAKKALEENNG